MSWRIRQKAVLPWEKMDRHGPHLMAWENKFPQGLPEPGAQAYAWESLGLVEFTPIGPSAVTQEPIRPTASQLYVGMAVAVAGLPTQAGGIVTQPLFDPSAGGSGYTINPPGPRGGELAPNTPYPGP